MSYIKNHKYSIEERAIKHYGTTEIFQFAGYLLEDGTMLNFSDGGYQRDQDHRNIGWFFKKASGTEALLKFMRRGNVRVMCHRDSYSFEYIRPLTTAQKLAIAEACKEASKLGYYFTLEKDEARGNPIKQWYDKEALHYLFKEG